MLTGVWIPGIFISGLGTSTDSVVGLTSPITLMAIPVVNQTDTILTY